MKEEYQTPPSTRRCAKTNRELKEGEVHWSVLYERDGRLQRVDFAPEAWSGAPADALCAWRTRVPTREEKKKPLVDPEVMFEFFTRLEDETDPAKVRFRYILALLLMRRKILRLADSVREAGQEYLIFSCRRTESTYRVLDPHLTEAAIADLQREVSQVLCVDT